MPPSSPGTSPAVVKGTIVVGDAGEAWVDSDLTEDEQRQAREWLAKRHVLGPGFSAVVSWLRADRVVGVICPRQSCKAIGHKLSTAVVEDDERLNGHLLNYYGCDKCGRTWRIHRGKARDALHVIS